MPPTPPASSGTAMATTSVNRLRRFIPSALIAQVDLASRAQPRFDRPLDPGVSQGGVFAREVNAPFRRDDVLVQQGLLARVEQGERAAGEFVVMPHLRCSAFEFSQ